MHQPEEPIEMEVRSVWASNLEEEFGRINAAVEGNYSHATFDAEFKLSLASDISGVAVPVAVMEGPQHPLFATPEKRYQAIKARADNGSIRQLGLTLSVAAHHASKTAPVLVWEFNLQPSRFDVPTENECIEPACFSNLLLASALVRNRRMTWIMFHSAYDIAYLMKLATSWSPLPESLPEFLSLVREFLGERVFDVKYMLVHTNNLYGGLNEVASALHVNRLVGRPHCAGSDSLLTWHVFLRLIQMYFADTSGIRFEGVLYGIHHI